MRIIIQVSMGTLAGSFQPGQETDWPDDDAQRMIAAGNAIPAPVPPGPQTATIAPARNAALPGPKLRKTPPKL